MEGRQEGRKEGREGGREGGRKEGRKEIEKRGTEGDDCHIFASFSLFDEIGHLKCLLSPLLLNAYSAAFSCTRGFVSSCAHPRANSHEINSTHPSFYLHHLAEAKTTLPKYPPPDKTYHPIAIVPIHFTYNCLSGLGSFEIRDLFLLHYVLLGKVYHQYETLIPPKLWINRLINFNTWCFIHFIQDVLHTVGE